MNKKGFTLIELLATILILGIVALIVFPTISDNITKQSETYEKVVCSYGDRTEEFRIDEILYNDISKVKIESNGRIYELQKNNCYLVGKGA